MINGITSEFKYTMQLPAGSAVGNVQRFLLDEGDTAEAHLGERPGAAVHARGSCIPCTGQRREPSRRLLAERDVQPRDDGHGVHEDVSERRRGER